jgi:ectoine hydroxylase-related dioxygenase (phytanoyl-CoA dioxygenase family)
VVYHHCLTILHERILEDGFALLPDVLSQQSVSDLLPALTDTRLRRSRAGARHILSHAAVAEIAKDIGLLSIARQVLGQHAFPFRATLFDKSATANWLVAWHQDTALPIERRAEVPGWGPWSLKDGVQYAHAPAAALEQVLALRLHLDDSTTENGPLRILSGTHRAGVLTDEQIHEMAAAKIGIECLIPIGGVLAMRPLVIHASSKSRSRLSRRVLHIEYAAHPRIAEPLKLAGPNGAR